VIFGLYLILRLIILSNYNISFHKFLISLNNNYIKILVLGCLLMNQKDIITNLENTSKDIRRLSLKTACMAGCGHTGGSLSAAEILSTLYFYALEKIDPKNPRREDRDRFILSKGHITPGFYSTLALKGFFPIDELLNTYDHNDTRLQGHPDMNKTPGVDISSGSLGQGLSCGIGMAMGAKIKNLNFNVYVLIGDGELQEGQIWEAVIYAGNNKIDNLIAVIDNNQLQLTGVTKEIINLSPLDEKFQMFGWHAVEVDGHSVKELVNAFDEIKSITGKPKVIIANTQKGKGFSKSLMNVLWHSKAPTQEELEQALKELS
jgi:transketolase